MATARALGILLGTAVDAWCGDPRRGHPVAGFGAVADRLERFDYADSRTAGMAHACLLVTAAISLGRVTESVTRHSAVLRTLATAAATWAVLGGSSLAAQGASMARELGSGDLDAARARLPSLCGRDAELLDEDGLARATVESVAENTSDAVVAPLFWGALAGVPGLLGYRAVNTLDAMVGHRSPRYRRFGWAPARIDDLANLVPARLSAVLTVLCAPVVGGSPRQAWLALHRDAAGHPSPNAGRVEAAFAGALETRLGGRTAYAHGVEDRPVLGIGRSPDPGHVTRSVELSRVVSTAAATLAALLALSRRAARPAGNQAQRVHLLRVQRVRGANST
ncbi:MAG: cobalamin biosynthesis protein [Sciscionella sp.]